MLKWQALCRPKDYGGLGFIDTRLMNIALLGKWIVKLESNSKDMSCVVLRKKYLKDGNSFFNSSAVGGGQFWKGLHACKPWLQRFVEKDVGDGNHTFFWEDVWLGHTPLKVQYPDLFTVSLQCKKTVRQVWDRGKWELKFRRQLSEKDQSDRQELMERIRMYEINSNWDRIVWPYGKKGEYSARSMYRLLSFGGVSDADMKDVWQCKIPLKIKHFVYLAMRGRIPCCVELIKKKWKGG